MAGTGTHSAWGALLAGVASFVALPLAVYLTRFSDAYELLHAALAIPVAGALGGLAVALARRRATLALGRARRARGAGLARLLGIAGLCMAAAALVALGVYGLLEYAGTRA